jgi:hypothetical protein
MNLRCYGIIDVRPDKTESMPNWEAIPEVAVDAAETVELPEDGAPTPTVAAYFGSSPLIVM